MLALKQILLSSMVGLIMSPSLAYAFGTDDGGVLGTFPSPLAVAPECKVGLGLFHVPIGQNDARNPLTIVGKDPAAMLSRLYEAQDFVSIPREDSPLTLVAKWAPGYAESLRSPAAKAALAMIEYARTQGIVLTVYSGYRPYSAQCEVLNTKLKKIFREHPEMNPKDPSTELAVIHDINTRSAFPGQSEHQLGTAADFATDIPGMGFVLEPEMDQTPAYAWMQKFAYRFGFVLSFPKGPEGAKAVNAKTGYVYEPWHWRYIGVKAATQYQSCIPGGVTTRQFLSALAKNPEFTCSYH